MSEQTNQPDYIVDTVTDPEGIRACAGAMRQQRVLRAYLICGPFMILLGILFLSGAQIYYGVLSILLGVGMIVLNRIMQPRLVKLEIEHMRRSFGTDSVPVHMVFWPQGVAMTNNFNHNVLNLRYEEVSALRFFQARYITIQAANGQWCILRREDIPEDLISYLLAKCPYARHKGFPKTK